MSTENLPKKPFYISNTVHEDERGGHRKFFGVLPETIEIPGFTAKEVFMTTNHRNTIRGLHFQSDYPQPKIIKLLTRGPLTVNLLCCDPTLKEFGETQSFKLSVDDEKRLYVPGKWALGYRSGNNDTRVLYIAGENFSPTGDTGIDPFDPELNIDWGITRDKAILSERDKNLMSWKEFVATQTHEVQLEFNF